MKKQKAIRQINPWWWPIQQFEYVVNAPVNDVIFMLHSYKQQNTWSFIGPRHLWIRVEPIKNNEEYAVKFSRRMGKNISVFLKADIKRISSKNTLIVGVAQGHKFTLVSLAILFLIHLIIVASQVNTWLQDINMFLAFEALFLAIIAILFGQIIFGIRHLTSKLEDIIKDATDLAQAKSDLGLANTQYANKKSGKSHAF